MCIRDRPYFEYVASKKNELWIATFNEAVQYLREKQHASLNINANDSGTLEVSITHDLPQDIFNYPLSVHTRVPADWNTVRVTQGDRSYTVAVSSRHVVYLSLIHIWPPIRKVQRRYGSWLVPVADKPGNASDD